MSDAVTSSHHSPHGLTSIELSSSSIQVMCPAMFSLNSAAARMRNAQASCCSRVSAGPAEGTMLGAHLASPPRGSVSVFTCSLLCVWG